MRLKKSGKWKLTIAFWQAISTKKHSSVTTINLLREERSDCRLDSRYASFLILLNFPDWLSVTSINWLSFLSWLGFQRWVSRQSELQDSGTKKFLFITGRIRLSILVLEKWMVVRRDPFFLSWRTFYLDEGWKWQGIDKCH